MSHISEEWYQAYLSKQPKAPVRLQKKDQIALTPSDFLAEQLTARQIPFAREFQFHPQRKWRADFCVKPALLIEVEGGTWKPKSRHTTGKGFDNDCQKYAAAMVLGYIVLRCTPSQIQDYKAITWITQLVGMNPVKDGPQPQHNP